jgi:hypothetical protein
LVQIDNIAPAGRHSIQRAGFLLRVCVEVTLKILRTEMNQQVDRLELAKRSDDFKGQIVEVEGIEEYQM